MSSLKRKEAIQVLQDLIEEKRVPSLVCYLRYTTGEEHGAPWHDDVDGVFGIAIVFLQDTPIGRLHIERVNLPELFYPGDVVFTDPRQRH